MSGLVKIHPASVRSLIMDGSEDGEVEFFFFSNLPLHAGKKAGQHSAKGYDSYLYGG